MKLKYILLSFLLSTSIFCQYKHSGLYAVNAYQLGLVSLSDGQKVYNQLNDVVNNININHSAIVGVSYKSPFKVDLNLGYYMSSNKIKFEGTSSHREYFVKTGYYSHTLYLGAGYNIGLSDNLDLNCGLGSELRFVKDENITKKKGTKDVIIVSNNSLLKGNSYIVPEISICNYFKNGDFISLGLRYSYSMHDDFLEFNISKFDLEGLKEKKYLTQNNCIGLFFKYAFKLSNKK